MKKGVGIEFIIRKIICGLRFLIKKIKKVIKEVELV